MPESFDSGQVGSLREIKSLIGAYEHLRMKFFSKQIAGEVKESNRKVKIVLFGDFRLVEVSMPRLLSGVTQTLLYFSPLGPAWSSIPSLFHAISFSPQHPRLQDYYPLPPPEFQLFLYMLRKHFKLKLGRRYFEQEWGNRQYLHGMSEASIFQVPRAEIRRNHEILEAYRLPVLS